MNDVIEDLAEAIKETIEKSQLKAHLEQKLQVVNSRLLFLDGKQDGLAPHFLGDREMTLKEAFDQDLDGLKSLVEGKPPPEEEK